MTKSDHLVCKLDEIIKEKSNEKVNILKKQLSDDLSDINASISQKKNNIINQINETITNINDKKEKIVNDFEQEYNQSSLPAIRSSRPDMTLLIEISVLVILLIVLYLIWPYLSASKSYLFSQEQYMKALELPESSFSIGELSQIRIELEAFKKYFEYFDSPPYSLENQGIYDLNKGVIFLPILSFMIIYIVPPFVILYIIWFIITYWKYVIAALWGWFLMIYSYTTKLIECKLASKWYIRMVTGWTECSPSFSEYFNAWRRQYVDIPVYYEKLRYVQEYYAIKQRYYTIPKKYYIDLPSERYQIKLEYLQKVYINRAAEVFLKKLVDIYGNYYEMPRDELYLYLLGNNKNLAALWSKINQTKKQVLGLPYESATPSGSKCTCPATDTPAKVIKNLISSDINLVNDDLKTAADKIKQLYDNISQIKESDTKPCETIVNNRNTIYFGLLSITILFFVILYAYSKIFGTPKWWYLIISPTWKFVTGLNLQLIFKGKWWDYSIYSIIAIFFAIVGYILYSVTGS